jgi:hypothetical protein
LPQVVTVTTKAIKVKSFFIIIGLFIIIIVDLILSCDSLSIFIYHFLKGASHTELLVENEILKTVSPQHSSAVN